MEVRILSQNLSQEIKFVADMEGLSIEEFVEAALDQHLNHRAKLTEFNAHIDKAAALSQGTVSRLKERIKNA